MTTYPLRAIAEALVAIAPLELAAPWDNVGTLCGSPEQEIGRILLCNDWDARVALEARAAGPLDDLLIVAYHPPWFRPVKSLLGPSPLYDAISGGAAIFSLHTAFDAAENGSCDQLAKKLGLAGARPLEPAESAPALGQGRVGLLAEPLAFAQFVERCKRVVGSDGALVAAGPALQNEAPVARVALAPGAGRSLLPAAIAAGADTLVTGELPHHDALLARQADVRVVALRHSVSERHALAEVACRLEAGFAGIPVALAQMDVDPFIFA